MAFMPADMAIEFNAFTDASQADDLIDTALLRYSLTEA